MENDTQRHANVPLPSPQQTQQEVSELSFSALSAKIEQNV